MATNVIFTRGNTATINATAITDGQILYNTTAGTQYLDNGTTRIQVGQNITVDTTLNSLSNNPIANRGVAGVMMSSLSEISTVTQAGNLPDALAVKALNSNLTANSTPFYYDYQNSKYGYNTDPARGADTFHPFKAAPIVHSATSASNTVTVEIGKEYIISAGIVSGYDVTSMSLSNCTIISSTSIVQSNANNSRSAWLETFYVKATGATLTLSWSVTTGGSNSTLQAITCLEL